MEWRLDDARVCLGQAVEDSDDLCYSMESEDESKVFFRRRRADEKGASRCVACC